MNPLRVLRRAPAAAWIGAAIVVFLARTGLAQDSAPFTTVVVDVTVIDVEAGEARRGRTVVIDGETITKIVPQAAFREAPGTRIVMGSGLFLMPGLIDAHVHYVDPDTYGPLHVANGVVLVREMGNATDTALDLRERLRKRELLGPEMVVTGAIIDGDPPVWPFSEKCKTAEDGRAAARKLEAAGVDQLKVYQRLPREAYFAILDEAKKLGKKAVGHVPTSVTLEEAIASGQASMEHLIGFERVIAKLAGASPSADTFRDFQNYPKVDKAALANVLDEVRKSGCVVCPTLVVMEGIARTAEPDLAKDPLQQYLPSYLKAFWDMGRYKQMAPSIKPTLPMREAFTKDLHEAGVALVCGTDLANPNVVAGFSLHHEMELFQRAGIPAPAVLRYATVAPARLLGVESRLGTVAEGRTASLVLLRKNPLEDVRHAAAIEGVFLRGHYYGRDALDAMLAEVRATCGGAEAPASRPKSGPATRSAPDMPGRPVASGTYEFSVGRFSAGIERFKITESEDDGGFHVWLSNEPTGGFDVPSLTTVELGRDLVFRSGTWRPDAKVPIDASYVLDGTTLRATARRQEKELPPRSIEVPSGGFVIPPGIVGDFATLRSLKLEPGQKRSAKVVGFGFRDWKPEVIDATFERLPDTTLDLPGRAAISVSHFKSTFETAMGAFVSDAWLGADGIPVKTSTKTPFGKTEATLKKD